MLTSPLAGLCRREEHKYGLTCSRVLTQYRTHSFKSRLIHTLFDSITRLDVNSHTITMARTTLQIRSNAKDIKFGHGYFCIVQKGTRAKDNMGYFCTIQRR